ncbi:ATP-dependent DNA helicase RecQ-like [Oscarella lobularis]|uniref:ATP-dependent DNA helicase RecQ-like n=1 Tax=Oscarella lobularis TaxID=121494 RepID=UPI00331369C9
MDATEEVPETSPEGILRNVFKLKEFRAGQLKAIESLRDGRDVVVRLSTNGGKSLVYQLFPRLFGDSSCCLVISPLSALMSEQVEKLRDLGLKAICLIVPAHAKDLSNKIIDRCQYCNQTLSVYMSPECAVSSSWMDVMKEIRHCLHLIAVDEAHCVAEW